jgi:hypothetical protein
MNKATPSSGSGHADILLRLRDSEVYVSNWEESAFSKQERYHSITIFARGECMRSSSPTHPMSCHTHFCSHIISHEFRKGREI